MNAQEIMDAVEFDTNGGCWLARAIAPSSGYGVWNGVGLAYRHSYKTFKGEIPKGLVVRHKCDVKACVNPDHLVLGTHGDNRRDLLVSMATKPWLYQKPERSVQGTTQRKLDGLAKIEALLSEVKSELESCLWTFGRKQKADALGHISTITQVEAAIRQRSEKIKTSRAKRGAPDWLPNAIRGLSVGDVKSSTKLRDE